LLQRTIIASGKALIWGESGGALHCVADAVKRYEQMLGPGKIRYEYGFGGNGAEEFKQFEESGKEGVHKWIACMNPHEEIIVAAFKKLFENIYAEPALKLGYARWGVKEVVAGIDTALLLKRLYPEAKFIFLVRNPYACLLSIKRRNWMDQKGEKDPLGFYANHWKTLATQFRKAGFGFYIRYEDLILKHDTLQSLMSYLEVENIQEDFILRSRVDWAAENEDDLSWLEKLRVSNLLGDETAAHGYSAI